MKPSPLCLSFLSVKIYFLISFGCDQAFPAAILPSVASISTRSPLPFSSLSTAQHPLWSRIPFSSDISRLYPLLNVSQRRRTVHFSTELLFLSLSLSVSGPCALLSAAHAAEARPRTRSYLSRNKEGKLRARYTSYEDARRHSRL